MSRRELGTTDQEGMLSSMPLEGRVALVTGGNGGLGKAIALGLRDAGAAVAVTGRDEEKNRAAAEELGPRCAVLRVDVRDEADVEAGVRRVLERFGAIDVLVNCAGSFRGGSVHELSIEAWNEVMASHLTGAFLASKHVARAMIEAGRGGKIINVGSMYSLFGAPDFADYSAAKSGVLGLTRSLAVELGRHNIQVNAILPGWYETDLTRGMPQTPVGDEIRRRTPAGRWGRPEDLVGVCVFLSSTAADFVSGACIPVDGGYSVADRTLYE